MQIQIVVSACKVSIYGSLSSNLYDLNG